MYKERVKQKLNVLYMNTVFAYAINIGKRWNRSVILFAVNFKILRHYIKYCAIKIGLLEDFFNQQSQHHFIL